MSSQLRRERRQVLSAFALAERSRACALASVLCCLRRGARSRRCAWKAGDVFEVEEEEEEELCAER